MAAYEYETHVYDVVVVGAGGAGLRATLGMAEQGLKHRLRHQGLSDPLAHRRSAGWDRGVAVEHGAGPLAVAHVRYGERARTGWVTPMRWSTSPARRPRRFTSSNTTACRSARTEDGKIYQRPFGGHTTEFGEGPPVQRTCAAADRTGHAILHTLYGQSRSSTHAEFYIEYFAIDLVMSDDGQCQGVLCWKLDDGTHAPLQPPRWSCWQRAAMAGPTSQCDHRPIPAPATVAGWSPGRGCRSRTWNSCNFTRRASMVLGVSDHRGCARRRRLSDQQRRRAVHGALCAPVQGPGSA